MEKITISINNNVICGLKTAAIMTMCTCHLQENGGRWVNCKPQDCDGNEDSLGDGEYKKSRCTL